MGMKERAVGIFFLTVIGVLLLFPDIGTETQISLLLFAVSSCILFWIRYRQFSIPKVFTAIYAVFILSKIISGVSVGFVFSTTQDLAFSVGILGIVLFSSVLFSQKDRLEDSLLKFLALIGGYLSTVGILEFTGRHLRAHTIGLFFPSYWTTESAFFFALLFPIIFAVYLDEKKKIVSLFFGLSTLLLSLAWILTNELILLLLFECIFVSVTFLTQRKVKAEKWTIATRKILLSILSVCIIGPNLITSFGTQLVPDTLSIRLFSHYFQDKGETLSYSLQTIAKNTTWGIGAGKFSQDHNRHLILPWKWSDHAGNEFLETWVENGFFVFAIEIILFLWIGLSILQKLIGAIREKNHIISAGCLGLFVFLISSVFTDTFRQGGTVLIFFVLLPIAFTNRSRIFVTGKILSLFWVTAFVFSFILLLNALVLVQGKRAVIQQNVHVGNKYLSFITGQPHFLINPKTFIWLSALSLSQKDFPGAEKFLKAASSAIGYSPENSYQLSALSYKTGKREEAKKILIDAISINPYVPPNLYLALSDIYEEEKNLPLRQYWLKRASLVYPITIDTNFDQIKVSILSSNNYLSSIQIMYYSLYELTANPYYFDSASKLNY